MSGTEDGKIFSYYIEDPTTGKITQINEQKSLGAHPCHLALSQDEKILILTNYSSGSIAHYKVNSDGSLEAGS